MPRADPGPEREAGTLEALGLRAHVVLRALRYRFRTNVPEIAFVRGFLRAGDVALDVGAYKGGITYWMAEAVGESGRVIAFEPQAGLARALRIALARHRQVRVESLAVSSATGRRVLHVPAASRPSGATLEDGLLDARCSDRIVPAVTLDAYLAERGIAQVALIKTDVEGHEMEVFRGAARTLETHRPALLFECERHHHRGASIVPYLSELQALGYEGFFLDRGGPRALSQFDEERDQVRGSGHYVNNFVFLARSSRP